MRLQPWSPGEGLKGSAPAKPKRADMGRKPRERNEKHLRAVAELPCLICGRMGVQVAHVRMNDGPAKKNPGMSQKPHDREVVPLCPTHHEEQHAGSEREFWQRYNLNPLLIAAELYAAPDHAAMLAIANRCRL